jgi:predicted DNA-binding transcriptional regulator AlpA
VTKTASVGVEPPIITIPETGFLRQSQILGKPKARPPVAGLLPISPSAWWLGIKEGRFPRPVKLGARAVGWRVEDIRALIARLSQGVA